MTIKELAYSAQQYLQASTGASFKRAHIYELMAASFGFHSHAAFGVDTVFTEFLHSDNQPDQQNELIKRRCIELGYQAETASLATSSLEAFLSERRLGVASISSLTRRMRAASINQGDGFENDVDELDELVDKSEFGPILLGSLEAAADNGNALAHYALALIYAPDEDDDPDVGSSYWYSQRQQGHVLTGVEKEWAEAHESRLAQAEKYKRHLMEAGRLGNQEALLELAVRFDDPSFFEEARHDVDADPAEIAAIAERMGRFVDARHWLTLAAEGGDTDAMLQLIDEYDQGDLLRCWTWVYLSQLVGTDLTIGEYYAINEDGSEYDDDIGGPAYAPGRDRVDLEPLAPEQDAAARLAAQNLFEQITREAH